jgi:DNA-binding FrmR family transcriptional regulator
VNRSVLAGDRGAAVRHAQRASGQVAALAGMIAAGDPFSDVAQQLLAARGSLDSLLVRLVELELGDCLPNREVRDEVDGLLRTALGRAASNRGPTRSRRRHLTTTTNAPHREERTG